MCHHSFRTMDDGVQQKSESEVLVQHHNTTVHFWVPAKCYRSLQVRTYMSVLLFCFAYLTISFFCINSSPPVFLLSALSAQNSDFKLIFHCVSHLYLYWQHTLSFVPQLIIQWRVSVVVGPGGAGPRVWGAHQRKASLQRCHKAPDTPVNSLHTIFIIYYIIRCTVDWLHSMLLSMNHPFHT